MQDYMTLFVEQFKCRFEDMPALKFISLAKVQDFPQYKVKFPDSSFGSLFSSPYGKFFNKSELKDELENLLADDILLSNSPSLTTILKRIKDQQIEICYSQIVKLFELILTFPISSASCERSFSCLKRVKNYLRNRMSDNRLNQLSLLSIEKDVCLRVDTEKVIERFATSSRRIELHFK